MATPESSFRRLTRSNENPWGIKLKSIPHHYDDAVDLLKAARLEKAKAERARSNGEIPVQKILFRYDQGKMRLDETAIVDMPQVVSCSEYYVDGMFADDRSVILKVNYRNKPIDDNAINENKNVNYDNDPSISEWFLHDSELGLDLASLDDKTREELYKVLPGYLNEALQSNTMTPVPNHEGTFLESSNAMMRPLSSCHNLPINVTKMT
jgi:hypothetical protein